MLITARRLSIGELLAYRLTVAHLVIRIQSDTALELASVAVSALVARRTEPVARLASGLGDMGDARRQQSTPPVGIL